MTVVLLQVLANFANDLGDFANGADRQKAIERSDRAVASRSHIRGQMKRAVVTTAVLALAVGVSTVCGLRETNSWRCCFGPPLGCLSIGAAYTYTAGSRPYGYSGLGDISVLTFFGIAGVAGTAAPHHGHL